MSACPKCGCEMITVPNGTHRGLPQFRIRCKRCHAIKCRDLHRKEHGKPIHSRSLHDSYVRQTLSTGTCVPVNAWPPALVALKRATMKLKRELLKV